MDVIIAIPFTIFTALLADTSRGTIHRYINKLQLFLYIFSIDKKWHGLCIYRF